MAWIFVLDLLSSGGTWSAVVTLLMGLVFFLAAVASDKPSAFWLHLVSGVLIGGSLLYWLHSANWQWWLIVVVALVYVGARPRDESFELGGARRARADLRGHALLDRLEPAERGRRMSP